jgi:multidrug efflux system membrane fusion protein
MNSAAVPDPVPPTPAKSRYRRRTFTFISVLLAALVFWQGAGYFCAYTDDAYLMSDLVSIAPQVSGPIHSVLVVDNQAVTKGALLFTVDPAPFQFQLDQAAANEAEAQSQIAIDRAALQNAQDFQASMLAQSQLTRTNLTRATDLIQSGNESLQALQDAQTAAGRAGDALAGAQAAVLRAEQMVRLHEIAIAAAGSARMLAAWRLARTRVMAPVDGRVTHFTLLPGDSAVADQPLVALVAAHSWFVIANYKEGVLRHLKPGARAWIWLDTHPFHFYRAQIQGTTQGIDRNRYTPNGLLPYVSPTLDWIRLQARIPVRFELLDSPPEAELFMGSDARALVIY